MAERVEIKQEDKTHQEYSLILNAFRRMVYNYQNSAERFEVFDDIISIRASFLIDQVLTGFGLTLTGHWRYCKVRIST